MKELDCKLEVLTSRGIKKRSVPTATVALQRCLCSCEVQSTSSEFREKKPPVGFPSLHSPLMRQYMEHRSYRYREEETILSYSRRLLGHNLRATIGVRGGDRTILHDGIHRVIGNSIFEASIPAKGKPPEACANTFSHLINS